MNAQKLKQSHTNSVTVHLKDIDFYEQPQIPATKKKEISMGHDYSPQRARLE